MGMLLLLVAALLLFLVAVREYRRRLEARQDAVKLVQMAEQYCAQAGISREQRTVAMRVMSALLKALSEDEIVDLRCAIDCPTRPFDAILYILQGRSAGLAWWRLTPEEQTVYVQLMDYSVNIH